MAPPDRPAALAVVARVPWSCWRPLVWLVAAGASLRPPRRVRDWQVNAATLTGSTPSRRDTVRAIMSWARNWIETLQVPRWGAARVNRTVLIDPAQERRLLTTAAESGAVIALPHSGSWDMAGAWACANGLAVSSVAEQLVAEEYRFFLDLREALGMRIHSHTDPRAIAKLIHDARRGRTVCLLADRDFSRHGLPVTWSTARGRLPATMPPGPAEVALRSGAALLGVVSTYEGRRMRLRIGEPITPRNPDADRREQAADMTQQLCDFFAAQLRERPVDWHMFRPFFGRPESAS